MKTKKYKVLVPDCMFVDKLTYDKEGNPRYEDRPSIGNISGYIHFNTLEELTNELEENYYCKVSSSDSYDIYYERYTDAKGYPANESDWKACFQGKICLFWEHFNISLENIIIERNITSEEIEQLIA